MSMMAANRLRRGRKRTDSIVTVEAQGAGLLCFSADGSWFEGQLEANDERDFDLHGRLVPDDPVPVPASAAGAPPADSDEEHAILLEPVNEEAASDDSGRPESPAAVTGGSGSGRVSSATSSPASLITPIAFEAAMRALAAVAPGAPVTYDVNIRDHEEGSEHRVRFVAGYSGESCALDSKELQFTAEKRYRGQRADMIIQKRLGSALLGQGCVVFTGKMRIEYQYDYLRTPKWCL
ncbi:uncharacterized protein LOC119105612 [Pollicipes pollicipes]|uniref:uncharacterized protein LOC119105612 n=1 Tax=Pollicipes pollicipes TaxID=41117 RepID=UPI001884F341|nr:uncharacterized protein LOC119105612 [Pollicipes pollicipes]